MSGITKEDVLFGLTSPDPMQRNLIIASAVGQRFKFKLYKTGIIAFDYCPHITDTDLLFSKRLKLRSITRTEFIEASTGLTFGGWEIWRITDIQKVENRVFYQLYHFYMTPTTNRLYSYWAYIGIEPIAPSKETKPHNILLFPNLF